MDGIRVGNKKPKDTISKSVMSADQFGNCLEDKSKHITKDNSNSSGEPVYGMPLFSAASKRAKE